MAHSPNGVSTKYNCHESSGRKQKWFTHSLHSSRMVFRSFNHFFFCLPWSSSKMTMSRLKSWKKSALYVVLNQLLSQENKDKNESKIFILLADAFLIDNKPTSFGSARWSGPPALFIVDNVGIDIVLNLRPKLFS